MSQDAEQNIISLESANDDDLRKRSLDERERARVKRDQGVATIEDLEVIARHPHIRRIRREEIYRGLRGWR